MEENKGRAGRKWKGIKEGQLKGKKHEGTSEKEGKNGRQGGRKKIQKKGRKRDKE